MLGNRTLLEIAREKISDLDSLAEIKGITDLILKRLGKDLVAAVKKGLRKPHGPIPRLDTTVRRRMDRETEKRLAGLKEWRGPRAQSLSLDPGVLCPNAALEAIAWANPTTAQEMKGIAELKGWFVREFGEEIVGVLASQAAAAANEPAPEPAEAGEARSEGSPRRSRRRSGRSRRAARAKKAAARSGAKSGG